MVFPGKANHNLLCLHTFPDVHVYKRIFRQKFPLRSCSTCNKKQGKFRENSVGIAWELPESGIDRGQRFLLDAPAVSIRNYPLHELAVRQFEIKLKMCHYQFRLAFD